MREPFNSYLVKIVKKVEDPVTRLSPERATVSDETWDEYKKSYCRIQNGNMCNTATNTVVKAKKYYIPFVAFALVLLLAFPCFTSLLWLQPVAFANMLIR